MRWRQAICIGGSWIGVGGFHYARGRKRRTRRYVRENKESPSAPMPNMGKLPLVRPMKKNKVKREMGTLHASIKSISLVRGGPS